jgi:phosphonatase-like hydrolase
MRLVLFDMAGTTLLDDDAVHRGMQATLVAASVSVTRDAVNRVMGLTKPEAIRRLLASANAPADADRIRTLHADFVARMRVHYAEHAAEIPGASEAFRRLHAAGLLVALDTGFDRAIADSALERLGWKASGLVDAVVTSDEVARVLDAEPTHRFEDQVGRWPAARDVTKVGDTPSDLLEGTAAGCRLVVGVTSGSHTRAELEPFPHSHLVHSVADVPRLVLGGPGARKVA